MSSPDQAEAFPHNWRAEVLANPPLIALARQFTYPRQVPGEEDAMARGALLLLIHPTDHPAFLATCARGFADPSMPTGIYSCPNPRELCALAGGYAYILDTAAPERCTHIPLKPVTQLLPLPAHNLLLFAGFHSLLAWGPDGIAWQTPRLSWEGLRISGVQSNTLRGIAWNMPTNQDVPYTVDLRTGAHTGGGF
jgi:hypothetical protein